MYAGWVLAVATLLLAAGLTNLQADPAATGAAATSATIVIDQGGIRKGFTPKASTMSQDAR